MDRGMEMGEVGEPSGAAPLRDASRHKCEGCGVETDLITPYCLICQVEGEIKSFLTDSEVGEARKRVRAALEAALAAPEPAPGEGSPSELDALRTELEEEKTARMSAERALDDWLDVHKEFAAAWKASGPDPFAHPSGPSQDSQEVLQSLANLLNESLHGASSCVAPFADNHPMMKLASRILALSQSPKGAAGATLTKPVVIELPDPAGRTIQEIEDEIGSAGGVGPSAPKTGLRGAPRLGGADELDSLADQPCTCTVHDGSHDCPSCEARAAINGAAESRRDALRAIKRKAPSSAPLSEAKGSDLPPSSQPAPGDVGEAGGVAV